MASVGLLVGVGTGVYKICNGDIKGGIFDIVVSVIGAALTGSFIRNIYRSNINSLTDKYMGDSWIDSKTRTGSCSVNSNQPIDYDSGWYNSDGTLNLPPNGGAIPGTETIVTLNPGDRVGRYGGVGPSSDYVTTLNANPDTLCLPPTTNPNIFTEFEVINSIAITTRSVVQPWGGCSGYGIQYILPFPILELIDFGYLGFA